MCNAPKMPKMEVKDPAPPPPPPEESAAYAQGAPEMTGRSRSRKASVRNRLRIDRNSSKSKRY